MITLYTFPGSFGCPSHSPYCVKAMCLLHMSGEAWTPEYLDNPTKMPYGKLPVSKIDGQLVPDSANLQRALTARGADFFPGLSDAQKAQAHTIQRMAEESLSFGLIYDRWMRDENWLVVRDVFFAAIPRLIRRPITGKIRKGVKAGLISHGFGRLNDTDRNALLDADLTALETLLGDMPFLFGDRPTAADASVLPLIDMFSSLPTATWLRSRVRGSKKLMAYVENGRAALYPPSTVRETRTKRTVGAQKPA